jgi:membrane protease YdiL (CAAX protease family)
MTAPDLSQAVEGDYLPALRKVTIPQHPLPTSIILHLLPGVVFLAVWFLVAPLVQRWGLPLAIAGSLAILFGQLPLVLGILLYQSRKETGHFSLRDVIAYRRPVPLWQYLIFVPLLCIWYFQASTIWTGLQNDLFSSLPWLPRWLENPLPFTDQGPSSPLVMTITFGVAMISSGMIAPIIEELYFRGFLLPRIDRLGVWAVLLNVSLFAFHHLWTPLLNPGRILAWFPIIFIVWRKQNIYIGLYVHLITNLMGNGLLALLSLL